MKSLVRQRSSSFGSRSWRVSEAGGSQCHFRRGIMHLFCVMVFVVLPASIGAFFFVVSGRLSSTSGILRLENHTCTDSSRSLKSSANALKEFVEGIDDPEAVNHEEYRPLPRLISDARFDNDGDPAHASPPVSLELMIRPSASNAIDQVVGQKHKNLDTATAAERAKQSRTLSVSLSRGNKLEPPTFSKSKKELHLEQPVPSLGEDSTSTSSDGEQPVVLDLELSHEHSAIEASNSEDEHETSPTSSAVTGPQEWLEFPVVENETAYLLEPFNRIDKSGCLNFRTSRIQIIKGPPGFELFISGSSSEKTGARPRLAAGVVYEITLASINKDGTKQCVGGDYFETVLHGPRWKSRPPVLDHNDGTYSIKFQIHPRFAGVHNFTLILLFANYEGLNRNPVRWARKETILSLEIDFFLPEVIHTVAESTSWVDKILGRTSSSSSSPPSLPKLRICERGDFDRKYWTGRWTREQEYECPMDEEGGINCPDRESLVDEVWSEGPVSSLRSEGWVYSAHCAFRIFKEEEAWQCLNNKWLYFWGDSNMEDSIKNLLNLVLGFDHRVPFIPRNFDETIVSPNDGGKYSVRITNIFNGHHEVDKNWEGLSSLLNPEYQSLIRSHFQNDTGPDFLIMNSGLHDGMFWKRIEQFHRDGVEHTWRFWSDVWENMKAKRPKIIYRSTVAAGGQQRILSMNPQKMEFFNHLLQDRLTQLNLTQLQFIDAFDMTYPWHFDHLTNDGVHYGRSPFNSKEAAYDSVGHKYFVDLMLGYVYLNTICGA